MLEAHVASQGDQRQPISECRGNEAGDFLISLVGRSFTDQINYPLSEPNPREDAADPSSRQPPK